MDARNSAICLSVSRVEIGIDCVDPDQIAPFWAIATGYTIGDYDPDNTYLDLRPPSDSLPIIYFQRVTEEKVAKNRVHLDLYTHDIETAAQLLETKGGRRIGTLQTGSAGGRWVVMCDPVGNEFCLCQS